MKTKEFMQVAKKITESNIFYNLKKGEHGKGFLGFTVFGSTDNHYRIIWQNYGTLYNIVITETAEQINKKLTDYGITQFVAKPTKSKRFCRLHNNF